MNFSLPKLSAVALLSLAAGFGASLWLNAEPEDAGQPYGPVVKDKCKYTFGEWNTNSIESYKLKHLKDPPAFDCTDCTENFFDDCDTEHTFNYKGIGRDGVTETDLARGGTRTTKDCTTCP